MKNKIIILFLIFILILSFGCTGWDKPAEEGKKCDTMECINDSFAKCEKAYGSFYVNPMMKFKLQVMGPVGEKCRYYMELEEMKTEDYDLPAGLGMYCNISEEDKKYFDEGDFKNMDCEGPLFESLKILSQVQQEE
jgi:hypothetical protein